MFHFTTEYFIINAVDFIPQSESRSGYVTCGCLNVYDDEVNHNKQKTRVLIPDTFCSSVLDLVPLGYKVLGVCIFAVKIMDITFRVFTAKISVFVFQLTTNFKRIVSFITCPQIVFALVTLTQLPPSGLGLMLLVRNCSTVTKHGARCSYCLQLLKLCSLDFIFFCNNNLLNLVV